MNDLKDSGERNTFETGAQRDPQSDTHRPDLVPASVINAILTVNKNIDEVSLETIYKDFLAFKTGSQKSLYICIHRLLCRVGDDRSIYSGIWELSKHYADGAGKYSERNWEKGLPIISFMKSAERHFLKALMLWDDEPHIVAALWNLVGLCWTLEQITWDRLPVDLDDRPQHMKGNFNVRKD